MIRLIENEKEFDLALLKSTLSGKKMLSYMKAYGLGYDFCRFYEISDENGKGYMFIINSTLIICSDDKLSASEELEMFIEMNLPFRIEGSQKILNELNTSEHYQRLHRTIFELIPDESCGKFEERKIPINHQALSYLTALSVLSPSEVRKLNIDKNGFEQIKQIVFFIIQNNIDTKLNSIETGIGIL